MNIFKIHSLTSALCDLAVFALVMTALTAIIVFFRVFKADFSED
jgi:hypothetical protein